MILNDHCSPYTLIHTILSPQTGPGGTFVISTQKNTSKISKSSHVRYPKVKPSLNYVPMDEVSYQKVPVMQIPL